MTMMMMMTMFLLPGLSWKITVKVKRLLWLLLFDKPNAFDTACLKQIC